MSEIINRVEKSSLVSLDLADYLNKSERVVFDIKDGLFQGVMLREKEFRVFVREQDWHSFEGKNVTVICSEDAIVPSWAYMLVATKLTPVANVVAFGGLDELEKVLIDQAVEKILKENIQDAKVVIKGCGDIKNRDYAYFQLAQALTPHVFSMMYGEPCSTVPVYKKKKA